MIASQGSARATSWWRDDARIARARAEWSAAGYYRDISFGAALAAAITEHPDDRLVFCSRTHPAEMTLSEVAGRAGVVASGLRELGLSRGDVLVGQLPQWSEQLELWYACTLLGVVYVPVIHIYGASELGHVIRDSRARALVVPDRWRKHDYLERIAQLPDDVELDIVVVLGDEVPAGCTSWSDVVRAGTAHPLTEPDPAIDPTDPCLMLYTSGTTSAPKGVLHSSQTLLAEFDTSRAILDRGSEGVTLDVSPAGHMASLIGVTRPLLHHNNLTVFMDAWEAEVALEAIAQHSVTSSGGPPYFLTTLLDLADARGDRLATLQDFALGGSAVPEPLALRAERRGLRTYRMYGSTEHPTVSCGHPSDDERRRTATDGHLLAGTAVRIVDEEGNDVPPGVDGEVLTYGPELMLGYTSIEANRAAFDERGYYRTGDIGTLSATGDLKITGRKKDIIIRGGENLSALEIEEVLMRHPSVREAAVIPMPDRVFVERVCAVVTLVEGGELDLEAVRRHFELADVAKQKTPERLIVLDQLPHTATGKVRKQDLRKLLDD